MHYANGREAKIGDVVRGKGYNIKHEIIGMLVNCNPAATACNCTVACVTAPWRKGAAMGMYSPVRALTQLTENGFEKMEYPQLTVDVAIEYGQLDAFVALNPETGDVLPPEVKSEL